MVIRHDRNLQSILLRQFILIARRDCRFLTRHTSSPKALCAIFPRSLYKSNKHCIAKKQRTYTGGLENQNISFDKHSNAISTY